MRDHLDLVQSESVYLRKSVAEAIKNCVPQESELSADELWAYFVLEQSKAAYLRKSVAEAIEG